MTDVREHMNRNFTIDEDNDKQIVITVKDDTGAAVNVNGFTAQWELIRLPDDRPVLVKTGAGQAEVTDATGGQITVTIARADIADLSGNFQHRLHVFDGSGNKATVAGGIINIEA